ncbi:hypothetical protein T4A_14265 [Trichinella pseudospiralis]|uniref:Uncharacterized protein n=1 Tax=Trichinella pseudospiralis TaxID=6337 RepID=A0A0V1ELL5_TRIPS|nr:hypothetical protein T4A_14265 [Trichinella pseudospiralis]
MIYPPYKDNRRHMQRKANFIRNPLKALQITCSTNFFEKMIIWNAICYLKLRLLEHEMLQRYFRLQSQRTTVPRFVQWDSFNENTFLHVTGHPFHVKQLQKSIIPKE